MSIAFRSILREKRLVILLIIHLSVPMGGKILRWWGSDLLTIFERSILQVMMIGECGIRKIFFLTRLRVVSFWWQHEILIEISDIISKNSQIRRMHKKRESVLYYLIFFLWLRMFCTNQKKSSMILSKECIMSWWNIFSLFFIPKIVTDHEYSRIFVWLCDDG